MMASIFYRCKIMWIVAGICLVCNPLSAQRSALDSLHKKFERHRIDLPQEKLYVHTDQELYLTGETMWFKIYYVDGALHHPIDISKVAYLEIIDSENHPVLQTKIALKEGEGNGSLFIPASINSGNYTLRAYTQWMKNFSPEYFFHKTISIANTFRKLETEKINTVRPFTLQFFPEGGNLVAGLQSKVAFQATDVNGKGIRFSGVILNEERDTIAKIQPHKFGIGHFTFTPVAGSSYRAVVTDSLGNSQTIALPLPSNSGFVMEVIDSSELLVINVASNLPSASSIFYFIHARQVVAASGIQSLVRGSTTIVVPKKDLSEGISHITLFDSNLQPRCERLYFRPPSKKLLIEVKTSQQEYGLRRKVVLEISSPDTKETAASMSVAVVRKDSLQQNTPGNIFHYLWLASDLKGDVESPGYYLDTSSPEVANALDNLMLTHGWRRFSWDDIIAEKKSVAVLIPEYRGHLIRGTVLDANGNPAPGIPTYLSAPGKNIQLYTARSKSNGEVQYEMKDFWGPRKIIVQPNTEQDTTIQIKIHNPYSEAFISRTLAPFTLPASLSKNLLTRSIAMQVQDIYNRDLSETFSIRSIDSTAFYGKASETYFLDDYTRFTVMEEVMREYVPGVMVRKRRDGFHFLVMDNVRKTLFQDNPLVLLDGTPIFDIDKIMDFDPLKIKKLEVLTHGYYLGPFAFSGVVSYSTYTGDLGGFQLDPKTLAIDYEGLQRQRVFYSPQYENQKQRESRIPDRRNLLFWAPNVTLDNDGRQTLEFFTADLVGEYTIEIQGISKKGAAGNASTTFAVKQFNN